jgi:DnaK suppressor protein
LNPFACPGGSREAADRVGRLVYGVRMDKERASELLAAERARLEQLLAQARSDELSDLDPDNQGEDLGDAELDAGFVQRHADALAAVERAEERLANGTYGVSVKSGKPIPDARLEAFPAAELTTEEAATEGA